MSSSVNNLVMFHVTVQQHSLWIVSGLITLLSKAIDASVLPSKPQAPKLSLENAKLASASLRVLQQLLHPKA